MDEHTVHELRGILDGDYAGFKDQLRHHIEHTPEVREFDTLTPEQQRTRCFKAVQSWLSKGFIQVEHLRGKKIRFLSYFLNTFGQMILEEFLRSLKRLPIMSKVQV
jgi:hypothetical protein